jgi:hypothetical protein
MENIYEAKSEPGKNWNCFGIFLSAACKPLTTWHGKYESAEERKSYHFYIETV